MVSCHCQASNLLVATNANWMTVLKLDRDERGWLIRIYSPILCIALLGFQISTYCISNMTHTLHLKWCWVGPWIFSSRVCFLSIAHSRKVIDCPLHIFCCLADTSFLIFLLEGMLGTQVLAIDYTKKMYRLVLRITGRGRMAVWQNPLSIFSGKQLQLTLMSFLRYQLRFLLICSSCAFHFLVPIFDMGCLQEKLCSKGRSEATIGEHLKENIVPAVEKFQKVSSTWP